MLSLHFSPPHVVSLTPLSSRRGRGPAQLPWLTIFPWPSWSLPGLPATLIYFHSLTAVCPSCAPSGAWTAHAWQRQQLGLDSPSAYL